MARIGEEKKLIKFLKEIGMEAQIENFKSKGLSLFLLEKLD